MTGRTTLRRRLHGLMFRLPAMITCREFEDFVLAYLEDELSPRQKRVFELHMKLCRECREYLAAYRRALDLAEGLADEDAEVLEDVPEDLVDAVLAAQRKSQPPC